MRSLVAVGAAVVLLLSACGSSDESGESKGADGSSKIAGPDESAFPDPEATGDAPAGEEGVLGGGAVEIVDHAFVQSGEYVNGVALLRATGEDAVGQFVTLGVNLLDADGQILASVDQVETFLWEGQELVFPIFASLTGSVAKSKVVSIDPVVSLADGFEKAAAPLPVLEATSVSKERYADTFVASFGFENTSGEPLQGLRVGVACFDEAGKVIGGTTTYPDAAPGRTIRIDATGIQTVARLKPDTCKAYVNYPV